MNPVVLSIFALGARKKNGQRSIPLEPMFQLIEFGTGLPRNTPVRGKWRHVPTLHAAVYDLHLQHGSRTMSMRLPPTWGKGGQGLYELIQQDDGDGDFSIVVVNQFTTEALVVPKDKMPRYEGGSLVPVEVLVVKQNWSEGDAAIGHEDDDLNVVFIRTLGEFARREGAWSNAEVVKTEPQHARRPTKAAFERPLSLARVFGDSDAGDGGCPQRPRRTATFASSAGPAAQAAPCCEASWQLPVAQHASSLACSDVSDIGDEELQSVLARTSGAKGQLLAVKTEE
jgi:hypothetical protein